MTPTNTVDAITLGESLGLVMGEPAAPLRAGSTVRFSFAGAESNVAIGLARLGHPVSFVTRVGDDSIGRMITETLRGEGVDVSGIVVDPAAHTALMIRQHRTADTLTVTYYRDGAAGSRLDPGDVPDLAGARLLHVTGITPALSSSARDTVTAAVRTARAAGLVVSLDVNYRSLLWSAAAAGAALAPLLDAVDIVFGGDDELLALAQRDDGDVDLAVSHLLQHRPSVVVRKRGSAGATAYGEFGVMERAALSVSAVDPVGAGDAFVAASSAGCSTASSRAAVWTVRSSAGRSPSRSTATGRAPRAGPSWGCRPGPSGCSDDLARVHHIVLDNERKGGIVTDFEAIFSRTPVMAILRGYAADRAVELARTAWDLGIVCVEVPVQSQETVQSLVAVVAAAEGRDVIVGAGTVTTSDRVESSRTAGAQFTVAPGFDVTVAEASVAAGMPHLPGVATPTEVEQALAHGHTWLKAFPASILTPAWIKAMAGPFPEARFVCTGGIDSRNAQAFLDDGARAVAVGSALESPEQLPALAKLIGGTGRPATAAESITP